MEDYKVELSFYPGEIWYAATYQEAIRVAAELLIARGDDTVNIWEKTADGGWNAVAYLKLKLVA